MANLGPDLNDSRFFITLADDLHQLDGKHTIFGQVAEGEDVLDKINAAFVDDDGRPYKDIRYGAVWARPEWARSRSSLAHGRASFVRMPPLL